MREGREYAEKRPLNFKMRKVDLCLSSEGTEVILATSNDEKHPPENIIDGFFLDTEVYKHCYFLSACFLTALSKVFAELNASLPALLLHCTDASCQFPLVPGLELILGIQKHFGPPRECFLRSSLFVFTNM
ncbi:intraflagellar transport protein 25 homolog isoform X4 [Nannospalax galili]|uniref:intraflagellar transport protein 25 homolog isoform X4 n=1 Tax=Nannospalax galili TaxID=1026970 RepID=UPI00111C13B7|nr:intraflagellar transport protein 25 homolog isoform X4 [Nannospalax galili]XP_029419341.1 intraflagellar transport protein 25 homolog isoform X4 [Nannospalax galili]